MSLTKMSAGALSMIACMRCLAGAPLGLGAAALGDVDELAEEVQRPLAVAVHERDVHERVDDVPVGVHVALSIA